MLSAPTIMTAGVQDLVIMIASFGTVRASGRVREARDTCTGVPALYLPALLGTVTHTSNVVDPASSAGLMRLTLPCDGSSWPVKVSVASSPNLRPVVCC